MGWATPGIISKEIQERVSEETVQYRIALGLAEPEERNSSNFPWSNSMTRDSTVFPRSRTLACATAFSLVEKNVPSGVAIFCLVRKNALIGVRFFWVAKKLQQNYSDYKRGKKTRFSSLSKVGFSV